MLVQSQLFQIHTRGRQHPATNLERACAVSYAHSHCYNNNNNNSISERTYLPV